MSIWTQLYHYKWGKPPLNMVLPPGEHNGKNDSVGRALSKCPSS